MGLARLSKSNKPFAIGLGNILTKRFSQVKI
jgi:hypothetical protein